MKYEHWSAEDLKSWERRKRREAAMARLSSRRDFLKALENIPPSFAGENRRVFIDIMNRERAMEVSSERRRWKEERSIIRESMPTGSPSPST